MLHTTLYLLLLFHGAPEPPQELPPYFVKIIQERTLFAQNEAAIITLRLGNQLERIIKPRKFPKLLENLRVFQGDRELERNTKYSSKDLYKKAANLGYGGHKDYRLNLRRYFPEVAKGGIFRINFKDKNYDIDGKNISVLKVPMPDLKVNYLMKTSKGNITIQLDPIQAPSHARNFALLVATQFYKDMIFHRVERNYVIQTGDPIGDGSGGSGFPVALEKSPFLRHKKYAVGMARKTDPNSADSQFYICLREEKQLDESYTAIGKVVSGFEVVDTIGVVKTTGPNGKPASKPIDDITLYSIEAVAKP